MMDSMGYDHCYITLDSGAGLGRSTSLGDKSHT